MGFWSGVKRIFTWWDGQTLNTQLFTWRRGTEVGTDAEGNVYYRNADDSKRWVIYNGAIEGSRVSPEWHGWLHHTWQEPPTARPIARRPWEKPHQANLTGTAAAYRPPGSIIGPSRPPTADYEAWSPE